MDKTDQVIPSGETMRSYVKPGRPSYSIVKEVGVGYIYRSKF